DLLDRPHVCRVLRAKKVVGSTLTPAVKTPFVVTHEVLAGQDWVFFDPDDRLREVQAALFEHWWIITDVSVATPDVKSPARLKYTGDVPEPGMEQPIELGF